MAVSVYPIYLTQVDGALAVVVGGGRVATRKVRGLLAAGARVRVVSPTLTETLQAWAAEDRLEWVARPYAPGDLEGAVLAFAATDQRAVNAQVAQDAARLGILCNVADAPQEGTFHVPAVARHQGMVVAVGSGGMDPGRAKRIRDEILQWLRGRVDA